MALDMVSRVKESCKIENQTVAAFHYLDVYLHIRLGIRKQATEAPHGIYPLCKNSLAYYLYKPSCIRLSHQGEVIRTLNTLNRDVLLAQHKIPAIRTQVRAVLQQPRRLFRLV